jgi:hypothetical protein
MMVAGAAFGSSALASLTPLSTATSDADARKPFKLYMGGIEAGQSYMAGSGSLSAAIGEQAALQFKLYAPTFPLEIGIPIRWMYFSEVLFDGLLTNWRIEVEPSQSLIVYSCTANDWTALLARHKINRNFIDASLVTIVDSLLDNELAGNGLSIGTIESWLALPLVDSQGGSALDVLKDAGAALGLVLTVDSDRRIHLRADSLPIAPFTINASIIEQVFTLDNSADDYRNMQTVVVTGTPSDNTTALVVTYAKENEDQIAERAAIEGTDGRYEAMDTLTHPTSNDIVDLQVLAQGYAEAKLATAGTLMRTITCVVRGYGWQPGQLGTVTQSTAGISGDYTIQQMNVQEIDTQLIRTTLTLMPDTLKQRSYQSWLRMIDRGKVVVQLPGTAATSRTTVTFSTPGSFNWTVPAGVTLITLTLTGASASGSGAWLVRSMTDPRIGCVGTAYNGKKGGNGGKAVASVSVTPGDEINLVVGGKGTLGGSYGELSLSGCPIFAAAPTNGQDATDTTAYRLGVLLAAAYKGTKSIAGTTSNLNGIAGANGGGSGGIVTVGGGKTGGAGGQYYGTQTGIPGADGMIEIEYVA